MGVSGLYAVYTNLFLKSFINACLRRYIDKLIYSLMVNAYIVLESHWEGLYEIIDTFINEE